MKKLIAATLSLGFLALLFSCASVPDTPLTEIYDDFSIPTYDGRVNPRLWTVSPDQLPSSYQRSGELLFSTKGEAIQESEKRLFSKTRLPLGKVHYIGAELSLEGGANAVSGHVAINLQCRISESKEFWIEADLINQTDHPVLFRKVGYFWSSQYEEHGFTYDKGMEYGAKYAVRIDLNESTAEVAWSVDGRIVDRTISEEYRKNVKKTARFVINSYRAEGSRLTTTVDDAAFDWKL